MNRVARLKGVYSTSASRSCGVRGMANSRSRSAAMTSRASSDLDTSYASGALCAVSLTRAKSSKISRFRAKISVIRWSTPSSESSLWTWTDSSWPIRRARAMACHSVSVSIAARKSPLTTRLEYSVAHRLPQSVTRELGHDLRRGTSKPSPAVRPPHPR